jgi:DNA-binding response OmpR family regulator
MNSAENKILVIEDDAEISGMLADFLKQNGFAVDTASNGLDGKKYALSRAYCLILLDLMLPYKSGDELLRELRVFSDTPVIVLSAKGLTKNKIDLLNIGADDYITKPFDLYELLARIQANLKRRTGRNIKGDGTFICGKIKIDSIGKTVRVGGIAVDLTAKEFALLELMVTNSKKVFSKQNLYESVWGEPYAYDNDTINTHISNLRKKLKKACNEDCIETVWGMGYKIRTLEIL